MVGIVNKPDINYGIWASNGDVAVPSSEKVEIGHIVEKPKKEIVNWIENRQDQFMAYLNQVGISEWDSKTTYKANVSFVNRSGTVYKAKSQNIDKDPTLNQDIWEISWATYSDFYNLSNKVDKIEAEEGYLNLYVSKANPVMTGKCNGVSYLNSTGVSGLTFSGTAPQIEKDGNVVGTFTGTQGDSDIVTFADLRAALQFYKIGDLYVTTINGNPNAILGYGTWERYAEGRTLVGVSNNSSTSPTWTRYVDSQFGEYTHQLVASELPKVTNYYYQRFTNQTSGDVVVGGIDPNGNPKFNNVEQMMATIGDTPHNIVQPSQTVFIWRRVA